MIQAKVTFIQKNPFPNFGVLSMAGYLKEHDITADVIIPEMEKNIFASLRKSNPDIIGITCMSTEYLWFLDFIKSLKICFPHVPVILGGVHATIYSHEIPSALPLDYICVGEGERLLVDLIRDLKNKSKDLSHIAGLCYKKDGGWIKNSLRDRIPCLDWKEDRDIYYQRYPQMAGDDLKQFLSGRGCYYNCNFCFNSQINSLYGNDAFKVRRKNPVLFISEINDVLLRYGARSLFFADDIFASDEKWLEEFISYYSASVGLPFMCTARADMITDKIAALLAKARCHTISIGVETGDENMRCEILGKRINNNVLLRASEILHDNKIRLQTSNMFVLPGETAEMAIKTIELNIKMKTKFAFTSFLMPFPNSKMASICQQSGFLKKDYTFKDMPNSFFSKSILDIPRKYIIENIQAAAYWCVRYPCLYPMLKKLVYIKFPLFFRIMFLSGLFFRYKEERCINFLSTLKLFWRFRKSA